MILWCNVSLSLLLVPCHNKFMSLKPSMTVSIKFTGMCELTVNKLEQLSQCSRRKKRRREVISTPLLKGCLGRQWKHCLCQNETLCYYYSLSNRYILLHTIKLFMSREYEDICYTQGINFHSAPKCIFLYTVWVYSSVHSVNKKISCWYVYSILAQHRRHFCLNFLILSSVSDAMTRIPRNIST